MLATFAVPCCRATPVARLPAPLPLPLPSPEPGTRTQPRPHPVTGPGSTEASVPQPRLTAAMADPKYADLPGIVSTRPGPAPQTAPPISQGPPRETNPRPLPLAAPSPPQGLSPLALRRLQRLLDCRPDRAGPLDSASGPLSGSSRFLRPEIASGRLPLVRECLCHPCQHCPCCPKFPDCPPPHPYSVGHLMMAFILPGKRLLLQKPCASRELCPLGAPVPTPHPQAGMCTSFVLPCILRVGRLAHKTLRTKALSHSQPLLRWSGMQGLTRGTVICLRQSRYQGLALSAMSRVTSLFSRWSLTPGPSLYLGLLRCGN